jgi:2-succinyl-6-hydroxy-2,4-cyclohexadiene-1-carboxylate synthase
MVPEGGAPWHLVGYSMGARLGLGLLASYPRRFASATLVGVNPGLAEDGDGQAARQQRTEADEQWAQLLERDGVDAFIARWDRLPLFASQRRLPPAVLESQRSIRRQQSAAGLAAAMRALSLGRMPNYRPALERVGVSLCFVVGSLDSKFLALAESLVEQLAVSPTPARLEVIDDTGHNVVLEAPTALAEIVRSQVTAAIGRR